MKNNSVCVKMWGSVIGYLGSEKNGAIGFQYDKDFLESGIEVSPIKMPLSEATYAFPALSEVTFKGLPGMIADSLPDKFGNAVIKRYLESVGRTEDSLNIIERLCYVGKRGMGALEFEPSVDVINPNGEIDLDAMTKLASEILSKKESVYISGSDNLIAQLMECGSSAGGARAKTLVAWNPKTNEVRAGQINAGDGYEYWLLKFDNIRNNKDKDDTPDDEEYTKIEYAYYLMAKRAGIVMSECRLYEENQSSHFMTKRFDRTGNKGEKVHMQSLCALAHMDFNTPRYYSYEDAFGVVEQLGLPYDDVLQLYRRMVFNEYAKNYDDHTKNISFLMDKNGDWALSPAYDVTFSYKKNSIWVNSHQMLINGKADNISETDFLNVARVARVRRADAIGAIEQVKDAVSNWRNFAASAGVSKHNCERIKIHLGF